MMVQKGKSFRYNVFSQTNIFLTFISFFALKNTLDSLFVGHNTLNRLSNLQTPPESPSPLETPSLGIYN